MPLKILTPEKIRNPVVPKVNTDIAKSNVS